MVDVELTVSADTLASWRLRMPHTSGWVDGLSRQQSERVREELRTVLSGQAWSTHMLVLAARRPA